MKRAVSPIIMGAATTGLVAHAAIVQGADPRLAWAGTGIGIVLGMAHAADRASLRFIGTALGALGGLQFFPCLPCDGSFIIMPALGALVCGLIGWMLQLIGEPFHDSYGSPIHSTMREIRG